MPTLAALHQGHVFVGVISNGLCMMQVIRDLVLKACVSVNTSHTQAHIFWCIWALTSWGGAYKAWILHRIIRTQHQKNTFYFPTPIQKREDALIQDRLEARGPCLFSSPSISFLQIPCLSSSPSISSLQMWWFKGHPLIWWLTCQLIRSWDRCQLLNRIWRLCEDYLYIVKAIKHSHHYPLE